jgi:hypothetical protein
MHVRRGLVLAYSEGDGDVAEERLKLEDIDEEAVATAAEQVAAFRLNASVELVVAANLEDSVRRRATDAVGATYAYERPDDQAVAARAFRPGDGVATIIMHAALFSGRPVHVRLREELGVNVFRVVQHEAWHVLLLQNDEDPLSQAKRIDSNGSDLPLALAAQFLDEFRVERAMFEDEWWRNNDVIGPEPLFRVVLRLLRAPQYPEDESMGAFFATRLGRAHHAIQVVAHEAARVVHLGINAEESVRQLNKWLPAGGPYWDEVYELLAPLPSARERISPKSFAATLRAARRITSAWMNHVGITPEFLGRVQGDIET